MIFTQMQALRGGTPIAGMPTLSVQIDTVNLDMMNFDAGAAPFDLFNIKVDYLDPGMVIKRNDKLQDVGVSNTGFYTISNKPEYFPDGHVETQAIQPVGS